MAHINAGLNYEYYTKQLTKWLRMNKLVSVRLSLEEKGYFYGKDFIIKSKRNIWVKCKKLYAIFMYDEKVQRRGENADRHIELKPNYIGIYRSMVVRKNVRYPLRRGSKWVATRI
ncbi:MAG TPA: hypothetical protein ENI23_06390 [bacterium]|nr:hypothetical protein [bacterium]